MVDYSYDIYGFPTRRKVVAIMDQTYSFDHHTGNLLHRTDNIRNIEEQFQYDNLNRLTGINDRSIICSDNGNITHIVASGNTAVEENSYDPWGRLRNPETHELYAPGTEPELMLGRGYTGHEHLTWFGLINMNARLYDQLIGRFLSPDGLQYKVMQYGLTKQEARVMEQLLINKYGLENLYNKINSIALNFGRCTIFINFAI